MLHLERQEGLIYNIMIVHIVSHRDAYVPTCVYKHSLLEIAKILSALVAKNQEVHVVRMQKHFRYTPSDLYTNMYSLNIAMISLHAGIAFS